MPYASGDQAMLQALEGFRQGLREYGWVEGQNIAIEYRYAGDREDRLRASAAELAAVKPDLILAASVSAIRAAKQATDTLPIVMASSGDPVGTGLVSGLARPGGNVTGLSAYQVQLAGKRPELLKEAVPRISRVAVLWNGANLMPTSSCDRAGSA